ncbi:MAG: hypothetical protein L6R41_001637 [Letrouitia leprolyta]|nr:MAG: hypothetical protein L6R41_001637 [Letrouitia leprolyta]
MERGPLAWVNRRADNRPLKITNQCKETIYPGIGTQAGTGPSTQGFKLTSGQSRDLTVSADWQGRVWGRTNCSFNAAGTAPSSSGTGVACGTGDCGGTVNCRGTGVVPVTLAEFTLSSSSGQTFYDISLVDGYNIPLGIIAINSDVPPNLTNPMCIGTASLLAAANSAIGREFGSNLQYQIPLEESVSWNDVQGWCPWDLQLDPPKKPGDGVYPYPDDNIKRPYFNPCFSACAKYSKASDCCTGSYNSPTVCKPSLYSTQSKKVCPDAYSFGKSHDYHSRVLLLTTVILAFDDQTSTFIIPSGPGFEVVFCPPGRSSTILKSMSSQRMELARYGLSEKLLRDSSNATLIAAQSVGSASIAFSQVLSILLTLAVILVSCHWT